MTDRHDRLPTMTTDPDRRGDLDTGGTTERLVIEPLRPVHAPGLFEALDDERVGRHLGGPDVTTLDELVARLRRLERGSGRDDERWINHAVLRDGTVVGRIEATLHDGIAEIAYVFGPAWWGRGFATEAVAWLIDRLRIAGHTDIRAAVAPANEASRRLLGRTGFRPIARPTSVPLLSFDDGDLVVVHGSVSPDGDDGVR